MAQKVLIIGESGTGKTASIRNCSPERTAIVSPEKEQLPFRAKGFEILKNTTDSGTITRFMGNQVKAGKDLIVIDDFQYILALPYMDRVHEAGWDKWNDFASNYMDIIEACKDLPANVVVAFLSHGETIDGGLFTVKLIGKMLREKITIEGLYNVVLRTAVQDGKYYFLTQNSGHDTVKSPMGMFERYAIDNDLNYVANKIRHYYELDGAPTEEEMAQADTKAAANLEKPDAKGHRARKSREKVFAENQQKADTYATAQVEANAPAADDKGEVPFEETAEVPAPDTEKPPRKTREEVHTPAEPAPDQEPEQPSGIKDGDMPEPVKRERKTRAIQPQGECPDDFTTNDVRQTVALTHDAYIKTADGNFKMLHSGEVMPEGAVEITHEEFVAGCKDLANAEAPATPAPARRRPRRTRG